ncbi:unnamed protein product [Albugo candida]|uniref:Uncharacterized protein n=1 Tax=Albugo candida TaxID=65357 RepID=A0A024G2U1_9STRA|nr:unnamed protein product [Albugo candida]|eukprot:CCI40633.1 unnamed protein product [Albugo candida]
MCAYLRFLLFDRNVGRLDLIQLKSFSHKVSRESEAISKAITKETAGRLDSAFPHKMQNSNPAENPQKLRFRKEALGTLRELDRYLLHDSDNEKDLYSTCDLND